MVNPYLNEIIAVIHPAGTWDEDRSFSAAVALCSFINNKQSEATIGLPTHLIEWARKKRAGYIQTYVEPVYDQIGDPVYAFAIAAVPNLVDSLSVRPGRDVPILNPALLIPNPYSPRVLPDSVAGR